MGGGNVTNFMKFSSATYITLLLALLLNACIAERWEKEAAVNKVAVNFYLTNPGKFGIDYFRGNITQVHVLVADNYGRFVEKRVFYKNDLPKKGMPYVQLQLRKNSKFQVVCWANMYEYTDFTGVSEGSDMENAKLQNISINEFKIAENFDPLFYAADTTDIGEYTPRLIEVGTENLNDTLAFVPAHSRVEIYIEDYRDFDAEISAEDEIPQLPLVELCNLPEGYDFYLKEAGETIAYGNMIPFNRVINDKYMTVYEFNTPLLDENTPACLKLTTPTTAATLFSLELKNFISQYHLDAHKSGVLVVPIHIVYRKDTEIEIKLASWVLNPVTPIL